MNITPQPVARGLPRVWRFTAFIGKYVSLADLRHLAALRDWRNCA
jgi:hypothetical protein